MKIRIGIVVSEFNIDITEVMLNAAKKHSESKKIEVSYICYTPGAFDMPLMVEEVIKKEEIDAVVTLGAIIKGDTNHDIIIAENVSRLISDISLKYKKPVSLGITGPNMTHQQAKDRIDNVSIRAVDAAINMTMRIHKIRSERSTKGKTVIID